jgi:hypothetical protein
LYETWAQRLATKNEVDCLIHLDPQALPNTLEEILSLVGGAKSVSKKLETLGCIS